MPRDKRSHTDQHTDVLLRRVFLPFQIILLMESTHSDTHSHLFTSTQHKTISPPADLSFTHLFSLKNLIINQYFKYLSKL